MTRFLLVCLGGAAGSGARYLVGGWAAQVFGATFPAGTLIVNAAGSLLISVVMHLGLTAGAISPELRIFLATGVMGGFTTYSSFNYELLALFERGAFWLGFTYLGATVLGCLGSGVLGLWAARWLWGG
ncbi:MAG TPA: CrcB family protein [Anaeromyxobacteraceae bacterium]|nr:CrcB family protein [Anaeromyxobacteraceae bacterium]